MGTSNQTNTNDIPASIHTLLVKAAHRRETYIWRKVIKPSDMGKNMSLIDRRHTRKFMRTCLEKAALRIWHSNLGERAGEWKFWLDHMRAAMFEDHPELAREFFESCGAL